MGLNPLDRLVRDYGCYDYMYEKYDPAYDYPPDLARALAAELTAEEAFEREQEAAKKTPPSTHSGE